MHTLSEDQAQTIRLALAARMLECQNAKGATPTTAIAARIYWQEEHDKALELWHDLRQQ